jgi:adenylylsulfate kinase
VGRTIWITGLSGAGKTTVAKRLKEALECDAYAHSRNSVQQTVLLDGDEMRQVFANGEAYDPDSRLQLAFSYGKLCKLMTEQGFTVICATISMRKEVYEWNRENLQNYFEVFLDVSDSVRAARDPKQLYAAHTAERLSNMAGRDFKVDQPATPDLHIVDEGDRTLNQTVTEILTALYPDLELAAMG